MTTVGIVGLGYVGLPLAVAFAEAGCDVVGVDVDARKVEAIAAGAPTSRTSPPSVCGRCSSASRRRRATRRLARADAVLICVPTPLTRQPRARPRAAARTPRASSPRCCGPGQLVVLESTTYPGTTRERVAPLLEEAGLAAGVDFHLAFSPERVDPGRTDFTLRNTPKVRRRPDRGLRRPRRALYGLRLRRGRARLDAPRRPS